MASNPFPGPEDQADAAAKRRRVIQARLEGATWDVAAVAGGYADRGSAYHAVTAALKNEREALGHDLVELRQVEDDRNNDLRQRLYAIIRADHVVVSQGRIVKDDDGVPLRDHAPVMAAIAQLGRIADRHALLHGLNAAKELSIALDARSSVEASVVADTLFAVADAMGLPPDMRRMMLETMGEQLARVADDSGAVG